MHEISAIRDGWLKTVQGDISQAEKMWKSKQFEMVEVRRGSYVVWSRHINRQAAGRLR